MTGRTTDHLPEPLNEPSEQIRHFGKIVNGDRQFALGETDYERDDCINYIRAALRVRGIDP